MFSRVAAEAFMRIGISNVAALLLSQWLHHRHTPGLSQHNCDSFPLRNKQLKGGQRQSKDLQWPEGWPKGHFSTLGCPLSSEVSLLSNLEINKCYNKSAVQWNLLPLSLYHRATHQIFLTYQTHFPLGKCNFQAARGRPRIIQAAKGRPKEHGSAFGWLKYPRVSSGRLKVAFS